jgi:hypothetical protein
MSSPVPFEPIAALLERSLNIKHVYGEPVQHGDTTVIPVAQVAYRFGAGTRPRSRSAGRTAIQRIALVVLQRGQATSPQAKAMFTCECLAVIHPLRKSTPTGNTRPVTG